ncbi:MAG: hypothetical protein DF168_00929 [Candidatus Moanabacter tarae]|uniref:DUF362 domain-containing protein n=1 Tax=Candidatus Moanibacter tarae TaxID=2200854 RepID=A0A2Z4AE78_9BACT|nr:MAG: hypothetical protein DF168_00929 [Candidatus Moanabacter tarae]|tara:strand:- start:10944 stop:12161 length:1218 start_codon:yes stop_codon:yes gene_type:complete
MSEKQYTVRAAHCNHRASDEEIYQTLKRVTNPLKRSWERLEKANRIVIKFNMMKQPEDVVYFEGRRQELVDDSICRAVLRLLRERTKADIVATDTNTYTPDKRIPDGFNYSYLLKEFDVAIDDSNAPPYASYDVPGGGNMFDRYTLSSVFKEADEVVSVAKLKNHLFMGITLCMKNLFGLPPMTLPSGRVRTYFHHAIRLSYVLPDLAMITNPCLNIIDALTGQWGREWGGEGRIANALIAGDQTTATDACGTHLMGHDPVSDWPTPPFRRDRNHLLVAAERGYGTVDLNEIDFQTEVTSPLNEFDSEEQDPPPIMASIRRSACEQGLFYNDKKKELAERFPNQFIYLQEGEVVWHGVDPSVIRSHRELATGNPGQARWLKLVDPDEREGENFLVYDNCLTSMAS